MINIERQLQCSVLTFEAKTIDLRNHASIGLGSEWRIYHFKAKR